MQFVMWRNSLFFFICNWINCYSCNLSKDERWCASGVYLCFLSTHGDPSLTGKRPCPDFPAWIPQLPLMCSVFYSIIRITTWIDCHLLCIDLHCVTLCVIGHKHNLWAKHVRMYIYVYRQYSDNFWKLLLVRTFFMDERWCASGFVLSCVQASLTFTLHLPYCKP